MSSLFLSRSGQDLFRQQTASPSPTTIITRHCTCCGKWKSPIGGTSKAIANSKRRAWPCAECKECK